MKKSAQYVAPAAPTAAPVTPPGRQWTCPMHPEIVRDAPGSCPICGMALEPRTAMLDEGPNSELVDMSRRFWVSGALTAPLLVGAMAGLIPAWLELALATPVCLWGAWPFFVRGWQSIVNRSLNMFTLIALGVAVSYGYSVVATLFPDLFPPGSRDESGEVGVYFEVAAVIVTLILLGQVLELRARSQTSSAIRKLLGMAATSARRIREDGGEEDVHLGPAQVGDLVRVRPGEKVPVDGVVVENTSAADESMVPGTTIPAQQPPNRRAVRSTINRRRTRIIPAEKVGSDT